MRVACGGCEEATLNLFKKVENIALGLRMLPRGVPQEPQRKNLGLKSANLYDEAYVSLKNQ